jgi:tRNA G18 (ribose-2'-O)-methylase SpoU
MFKIIGKHSILSACLNKKRKRKIFHGEKRTYDALNLTCSFQSSREEFLETNEWYLPATFEEILETNRIILMDSLEDPHNLGSIIRSAAILGYSVLVRKNKGCNINQTVLKCAAGGCDVAPIMEILNLQETLRKIKDRGYWIYALSENGNSTVKINSQILLVVGSEGQGIKSLTKKNCDYLFRLSGRENFCVYNASVAAAISMYQFKCQTWDSNP